LLSVFLTSQQTLDGVLADRFGKARIYSMEKVTLYVLFDSLQINFQLAAEFTVLEFRTIDQPIQKLKLSGQRI